MPFCRGSVRLLLLPALFLPVLYGQRPIETVNGKQAAAGEVIVKYRDGGVAARIPDLTLDISESHSLGPGQSVRLLKSRTRSAAAMVAQLSNRPDVEFVEPNYVVRHRAAPNDNYYALLWGLSNTGQVFYGEPGLPGAEIGARAAWDVTTGSESVAVGIVDTGVDYNHPDLQPNMWTAPRAFSVVVGGRTINCPAGSHGFDAIANSCNPMDDHGHGTHIAGTIGASGNNGLGVTGINWKTRILALRFMDAKGSGYTSDAIEAIDFAIQAKAVFGTALNVRVLSNSWGGPGYSQALLEAVRRANDANILFVVAAGNEASSNDVTPDYPGNFPVPNIISVAATDHRDRIAGFSNYGPTTVHVGAPGVAILSTYQGQYAYLSGTSMATPHVAGAAALVLSKCAADTAGLKNLLLTTADPVAALSGKTITGGRVNVNRALAACSGGTSTARLTISPSTVTLSAGQSQAFTATEAVDWALSSQNGTIGAGGVYTAPAFVASSQTVTLTATSRVRPGMTAQAVIQLTPSGVPAVPGTLSATSFIAECGAGSGSVNLNLPAGLPWSASSEAPWMSIAGSPSGTGGAVITFSYTANGCGATAGSPRTGRLNINGNFFTVTQRRTSKTFTDVLKDSIYFDAANVMFSRKITSGCAVAPEPPAYCPDFDLTREQMAVFLVRAWSLKLFGGPESFRTYSPPSTKPYFTDVPQFIENDPSRPNLWFPYVQKLKELGITSGCTLTQYCPSFPVSNLEIAIFTVRARQSVDKLCVTNCVVEDFADYTAAPYFSDEPKPPLGASLSAQRQFAFIQKAVDIGAVTPSRATPNCTAGRFCRNERMTRWVKALYVMKGILNEAVE